jgi:PKHD-type hydroxylase
MELPFLWSAPVEGDGCASVLSDDDSLSTVRPSFYGLEGNQHLQQPFVYPRVFSPQQCEHIKSLGNSLQMWKGKSSSSDSGYRVCKTSWIEETQDSQFIFRRLRQVVDSANEFYQFAVSGFSEPLHYICYEAGGEFQWHTDIGDGPTSTRKLSVSIQLSAADEYSSGDLEFCPHGVIPEFRGVGNAIIFPSYIAHRVSPVTAGHRHALVAWIHGPAFR